MEKQIIENEEFQITIPYMSIYNDTKADFPYISNILNSMKHQDDIGMIFGLHPTYNLKYYTTFYYTPGDFLTEGEV